MSVIERDPLAVRLTGYVPHRPHPPQHAFLLLDNPEAFYGGAAGGGKSDALLMAALQYVDVPGYAAILFRRTYADLAKPGALMARAKEWLKGTDAHWNEGKKTWTFPSSATLSFGYLQHPDHRYNYQSAEFQMVGFDELTQFEEPDYRYLFSRLRKPSEGPLSVVPLRMRGASNPGGRGHVWVRNRFIKKLQSDLDDEMGTDPGERIFIPAKLPDNPSIDQDAYVKQLLHLDPQTRQQLLDGDWDAREPGACFHEFKWAQHTLEGTRHENSHFPVVHAIDFGLHHNPCLWIEVQSNQAFVFAELDAREQDLHKTAQDIIEIDREFDVEGCESYIDPAGLSTSYQTGRTDADVLREHGIQVSNLDTTDRYTPETRTAFIKYLLRTNRLFISRSECPYLVEALERAQWARLSGTGALKDTYAKDGLWEHPLDALGEALVRIFRPFPAAAVETAPAAIGTVVGGYGGSEFG